MDKLKSVERAKQESFTGFFFFKKKSELQRFIEKTINKTKITGMLYYLVTFLSK